MANTQTENQQGKSSNTSNRGFASMDPDKQKEIASEGGESVSQDREHMAEIGAEGGRSRSGQSSSGGGSRSSSQQSEAGRQSHKSS